MKTLKLRIMVRAFRIRLNAGETFEDIAADYPALTTDDLEAIKTALEQTKSRQPRWTVCGELIEQIGMTACAEQKKH